MSEENQENLKELLRRWGRFPAHDEADFNCLVSEVVAALSEGADTQDLVAVIQNEFFSHFGSPGPQDEVVTIAETVTAWAKENNPF